MFDGPAGRFSMARSGGEAKAYRLAGSSLREGYWGFGSIGSSTQVFSPIVDAFTMWLPFILTFATNNSKDVVRQMLNLHRNFDEHGPAGPTAFWKSYDGVEVQKPRQDHDLHALHMPLY